jgi:predicted thioesterase
MDGSDVIKAGLRGEATLVVTDADTAIALKSGHVRVLGTPRLIALCEEATMAALRDHVPAGHASVGMRVQLDHLQPTAVGGEVVAEAVLDKVEGRRLKFTVSASDSRGLVAAGKVTRVIVELQHFMDKARR